jgi:hypothetical protein
VLYNTPNPLDLICCRVARFPDQVRRRGLASAAGSALGAPARRTPGYMLARLVIKNIFPGHSQTGQRGSSRSAQAASHNVLTVTRMLLRAVPTGGQNQKVPLPSCAGAPRQSPGMPS